MAKRLRPEGRSNRGRSLRLADAFILGVVVVSLAAGAERRLPLSARPAAQPVRSDAGYLTRAATLLTTPVAGNYREAEGTMPAIARLVSPHGSRATSSNRRNHPRPIALHGVGRPAAGASSGWKTGTPQPPSAATARP